MFSIEQEHCKLEIDVAINVQSKSGNLFQCMMSSHILRGGIDIFSAFEFTIDRKVTSGDSSSKIKTNYN